MKEEKKWMDRRASGFTLVELIVVLVILSVLSAAAVPSVLGFIDDSKAKECESRMKALAADIATAKMSYEVDGTESGEKFGTELVNEYIADAGEDGQCQGKRYNAIDAEGSIQLTCPNHSVTCDIPDSGSFSVAVVENTREEADSPSTSTPGSAATSIPESTVTPTPESIATPTPKPTATPEPTATPTLMPETTYKAEIGPASLALEEGGAPGNLTVTITDETTGEAVPDSKVSTRWYYQGDDGSVNVIPDSAGALQAVVEAVKEGKAQVYCNVTVTDDSGRERTVTAGPADVTVNRKKPELHLEVGPLEVDAGKDGNLDARATDENGNVYPEEVVYYYEVTPQEGDDGEVTVDANGKIHGDKPGTCHVTVTVQDKNDPDKKESKMVDVTVTEVQDTQPELDLQVPSGLTVREGDDNTELPGGIQIFDEKGQPYSDVTVTYSSNDEDTVTVDPVTGKVHGVNPGECEVTVTVTDNKTNKSVSKNVKVNVEEKESDDGFFDPNEMHIWIHDRGAQELEKEEVFANLLKNLPAGTWSYYSGDGGRIEHPNGNDVKLFVDTFGATGPFVLKYETTDGKVDYLTITAGYPIKSVQKPDSSVKNGMKVGDTIMYNTVLNPEETTDVPIRWESTGTAEVELSPVSGNERLDKINVKILSEGTLQMRAIAHCVETNEDVVSDWSDMLTIGDVNNGNQQQTENQSGIAGVMLSPNPMNLRVNEFGTITATIQTKEGSEIDPSKVKYSFNVWDQSIITTDSQQKQSVNTATVTGVKAGNTGIGVEVYYDDQQVANTFCNVKVEASAGITGVTLSPDSMTLRKGQSGQLEAIVQTWGDVDASKISYNFYNYTSYALSTVSPGGATAIVTGMNAGQSDTVYVDVSYDNKWAAKAQCLVTVEEVPADEAVIDGNCFGAMSWAEFKKAVEMLNGEDFKANNGRDNPEKEDKVILFYDEEEVNGVKKRTLYVAHGNSANFSTGKTPVSGSNSFKDFLATSGGKDKFAAVDLEHIIYIDEENLASAPAEDGGWPDGTVVRVRKSTGEYEYYVAYDRGNEKTQLNKVGKTKEEKSGWWKLNQNPLS